MDSTDVSGIDGNIARSDNLSTVPTCKLSTLDNSDIEVKEVKRTMTTFQTFFALLKAYCAINVLLLPLSFKNGGYILSPVMMIIACCFMTLCAIQLATVAKAYNIYNYPKIA